MNGHKVENIAAVISYIEAHLNEKLDLGTVANAVCYSKYHLRRPLKAYTRFRSIPFRRLCRLSSTGGGRGKDRKGMGN